MEKAAKKIRKTMSEHKSSINCDIECIRKRLTDLQNELMVAKGKG